MRDRGARRILAILDAAGADARSVGIEVGEDAVVHDFTPTRWLRCASSTQATCASRSTTSVVTSPCRNSTRCVPTP